MFKLIDSLINGSDSVSEAILRREQSNRISLSQNCVTSSKTGGRLYTLSGAITRDEQFQVSETVEPHNGQ
jgi:hypothetical protein